MPKCNVSFFVKNYTFPVKTTDNFTYSFPNVQYAGIEYRFRLEIIIINFDELSAICGQLKLYADDGKNMFLMLLMKVVLDYF